MIATNRQLIDVLAAFETLPCATQEEWLALRLMGIGASESSALFGVNPFESLYSLWARKRQKIAMSLEESEAMEWGKRLEDPIAQAYADKTGRVLADLGRRTILRSTSDPWMFATLDRVITSEARGPGVLEIKTAGEFRREDWEADEIPLNYQVQVQHQMAVTGYGWGSIAVLVGGNKFGWRDVERNEAFIAKLRGLGEAFWRMVETGEAPEVDGSDHTTEAMKALYSPTGEEIALSEEAQAWDAEHEKLRAEIDALKERQKLLNNQLREAVGNAAIARLPDGSRWALTKGPRAGYVVAPNIVSTFKRYDPPKAKTKSTKGKA